VFHKRPLTWLFVASTIAIDLVLITVESDRALLAAVKLGFVLGQLAAMAIWVVRGRIHRLARASCLVVTTSLLAYLIEVVPSSTLPWAVFYTGYAFLIVIVTLLSDLTRHRRREKSSSDKWARRWKISLMECFGWTIVVAMASFSARGMEFYFLRRETFAMIVALSAVPSCMALLIRTDLRDVRATRALGISLIIIIAAYYSATGQPSGEFTTFIQAAYLVLWMAVLGMDDVLSCARNVGKSNQEKNPHVDVLRLFEPQD